MLKLDGSELIEKEFLRPIAGISQWQNSNKPFLGD